MNKKDLFSRQNEETERLRKKFGDLLKGVRGTIEVGPGWIPLLEDLLGRLAELSTTEEPIEITCIKEKFAGLRVYLEAFESLDEVSTAILLAEIESYSTCELCGATEEVATCSIEGWLKTYCAACTKEEDGKPTKRIPVTLTRGLTTKVIKAG